MKAKGVVQKEGTPRVYIRALAELEDFVKEVWQFGVFFILYNGQEVCVIDIFCKGSAYYVLKHPNTVFQMFFFFFSSLYFRFFHILV